MAAIISTFGAIASVVVSGCACPLMNLATIKAKALLVTKLPYFKKKQCQDTMVKFGDELKKFRRKLLIVENILQSTVGPGEKDIGLNFWFLAVHDCVFQAIALSEKISEKVSNYPATVNVFEGLLNDIQRFISDIDALLEEHKTFLVHEPFGHLGNEGIGVQGMESSSIMHKKDIFGREETNNSLLGIIDNCTEKVSVVSVYGHAGVGKTTLARMIYNSTTRFEVKIWISMHGEFCLRSVTRSMIEHISKNKCELLGLDALQAKLRELLYSKRFLVVLDGAWHENLKDWRILFASLRVGGLGSTILVTTQSHIVTTQICCTDKLHLQPEKECEFIFKSEAFHGEITNDDLKEIGEQIVKKCYGMPLVASTLGRLLYMNENKHDWEYILRTKMHRLPKGNDISSTLRLAHSHLPINLRILFAYFAVYPQNHQIRRDDLVRLWIAEGFINPTNGMSLEDMAQSFFDDLHHRSFL